MSIILEINIFCPVLWNNKSMESFGEILKTLRTEKKLTQVELANKLGVGKSIISLWEKDECEPTLSKLRAIANFFGVTIDYLAGIEK